MLQVRYTIDAIYPYNHDERRKIKSGDVNIYSIYFLNPNRTFNPSI